MACGCAPAVDGEWPPTPSKLPKKQVLVHQQRLLNAQFLRYTGEVEFFRRGQLAAKMAQLDSRPLLLFPRAQIRSQLRRNAVDRHHPGSFGNRRVLWAAREVPQVAHTDASA